MCIICHNFIHTNFCFFLFQTRDYDNECSGGGNISLLNHHPVKMEETNCNILLNTIVHNDRAHHSPSRVRRPPPGPLDRDHGHSELYSETGALMFEMLSHVKQMNEEIHQRHVVDDADEHYKSEWRMVALALDRILLILFFLMTLFTCIVIFINVPDWGGETPVHGES